MRKYELTYLVSDEVPENDLNKVTGKVTGFVTELGGKLAKEDIWGRRKLAYPIKKQDFATYVTLYFDLPAEKVTEFDRDLRQIDGLLRHLMIVKDLGDEAITLIKEEITDTEDIKEVVGGERSFEAIEGETEESRDLMAKREEAAKETTTEVAKAEEKAEVKVAAEKKPAKEAKAKEEKIVEIEEPKAEAKPKKTAKKKEEEPKAEAPKNKKVNDEVERLSKLNEELDDILKDEL